MRDQSEDNTENRIRWLVYRLQEAGCEVTAVGQGYVIGEPEDQEQKSEMMRILQDFGPRSHLAERISDHLKSIGLVIEVE